MHYKLHAWPYRDMLGLASIYDRSRMFSRTLSCKVPYLVAAITSGFGVISPASYNTRPAQPLLCGYGFDVEIEHLGKSPASRQVHVQRVALVLREHDDLQHPAVDEVGQHAIDQPIPTGDGDRWLGAVLRQRQQALDQHPREDLSRGSDGPIQGKAGLAGAERALHRKGHSVDAQG